MTPNVSKTIEFADPVVAAVPEQEVLVPNVPALPGSDYTDLQSSFGNSLLAAAATSGSPPDGTPPLPAHHTFGNAAVSRSLIQRKANGRNVTSSEASPGASDSSGSSASARAPGQGLIVDDTAETVQPSQMKKSAFLAQLRSAANAAVAEGSAGSPLPSLVNPEIERRFAQANRASGPDLEQAIRSQFPEAAGANTAAGFIPPIVARVRREAMPSAATGVLGAVGGAVSQIASGITSAASAVAEGVGGAVSAIGNLFFKARDEGARETQDPTAIQSQLGAGQPLDGGVRSRMESAYGQSFSSVEVHADANAGGLSENLNARAFTVGQHIAFGDGEYQPGTLIGDALIAHELAHVMQQRGGVASDAPAQKGATEYGALEEDADEAAVAAVVSTWGGARRGLATVSKRAMVGLKSGLRLQRCTDDRPVEQTFIPMSAVEIEAIGRMRTDVAAAEAMLRDPDLSEEDRATIRQAIQNARGSLQRYIQIREEGATRAYVMAPIVASSAVIVGDDVTVVGVADDWLLIVTGLAALATIILTSPTAPRDVVGEAWLNAGRGINELANVIDTLVLMTAAGNVIHQHLVDEAKRRAVAAGLAASVGAVTQEMVCEMLKRMAQESRRSDSETWRKLIATMKGLGCRHRASR